VGRLRINERLAGNQRIRLATELDQADHEI
jgi:hypothetical protein